MSPRRIAVQLLVAVLLASMVTARPVRAQMRGDLHRNPAAADTAGHFPAWLHPWAEFGGSWLTAPQFMRGSYKAGEAFAIGLGTRPRKWLEVRAALDLQTLQVERSAQIITNLAFGSAPDTLTYQYTSTSWTGVLRPEIGVSPGLGLWLTAGAGGGFMDAGSNDNQGNIDPGPNTTGPISTRNGWGWFWTASARWEFEPIDVLPLGLEARTMSMRRGPDDVRTASIRVSYRIPSEFMRRGPRR